MQRIKQVKSIFVFAVDPGAVLRLNSALDRRLRSILVTHVLQVHRSTDACSQRPVVRTISRLRVVLLVINDLGVLGRWGSSLIFRRVFPFRSDDTKCIQNLLRNLEGQVLWLDPLISNLYALSPHDFQVLEETQSYLLPYLLIATWVCEDVHID